MSPLRYSTNVTLDGCCDHQAIPAEKELHRYFAGSVAQADALLFGRLTYEMMEAAWRRLSTGVLTSNLNTTSRSEGASVATIVNIDVMLTKRKMSVTELAERVGITMANVSILKNGKARAIRFSTPEGICRALDCQPGDILEYLPDARHTRLSSRRPLEPSHSIPPSPLDVEPVALAMATTPRSHPRPQQQWRGTLFR